MSSVLDEVVDAVEPAPDILSVIAGTHPAVALSVDVGTSGVRAALFDAQGKEISGIFLSRIDSTSPRSFHEFDPDLILKKVIEAIDELLAGSSDVPFMMEAIAISCFWHSLMGIDGAGSPITRLLTWADTRAAAAVKHLRQRFDEDQIHCRTGCRFHPSYWPAKLLWLRSEQPNAFARVRRWIGFTEFLSLRLFDQQAMSVSMASATGLFDNGKQQWDESFVDDLGIPLETLPNIDNSGPQLVDKFRSRWPVLAEARLCGVYGDGATNNVGGGCLTKDKAALMVGTSGALRVAYEDNTPDELPSELWCYRIDRKRIVVGGALSDGGGLYRWLTESLFLADDPATIEIQLSRMEPDEHGLTILPFWSGERSTGWSATARGAIVGITQQTQPIEIIRAALEAVAYRFAAVMEALQPLVGKPKIVATGNALRSSAVWLQIMADVLNCEILLSGLLESSTRGAALLALEGMGKIDGIEQRAIPIERIFEPNNETQRRYQYGRERHDRLYQRLILEER
ncbi:MAG: gluconokinase [Pyrinomonadaceae bacterium]